MSGILRAWSLAALCLFTTAGISADAAETLRGLTVRAAGRHRPVIIRHVREGAASSSKWSGYAGTGSKGSVRDVTSSGVVPSVTCDSRTGYSLLLVAIDEFTARTAD